MKLRKINAVFSLICTILLLDHAIFLAVWMLSQGSIPNTASAVPRILTVFFLVHAIISIVLMVLAHKDNKGHKGREYPRLNAATIVQRISGVLMIIFTALHILGATGVTQTPQMMHAIVSPLFFFLVLVHVAISTSKALITLGIGNAKFVKRADIVIKVICAATLVADVIGFYLYVC